MAMLDEIFMDELVDDPDPMVVEEARQFEEDYDNDEENGDEQPPPNNSEPSEDAVRVEPPKKKVIRNPQPKLNPQRLIGPRGIQCIEQYFKNVKFKGKGHELSDLNIIMSNLEHWANRLYPRANFDAVLSKLELLGHKRPVMVHVKKIRLGMIEELGQDSNLVLSDTETPAPADQPRTSDDIFNDLLNSQPTQRPVPKITEAQRERMMRNRQMAEEKRLARMAAEAEKAATLQSIEFQNALIETEGSQRENILVTGEVGNAPVSDEKIGGETSESAVAVEKSEEESVLGGSVVEEVVSLGSDAVKESGEDTVKVSSGDKVDVSGIPKDVGNFLCSQEWDEMEMNEGEVKKVDGVAMGGKVDEQTDDPMGEV